MQLTTIQVEREEFLHSRILERSDRIKSDWLQISNDLKEIKKDKLYLRKAKTFEEYCKACFDMGCNMAYKFIASGEVIKNLDVYNCTHLPTSESQARPLTKLEPELQREAWAEVIEENEPEAITAKIITAKVETKKELNEAVREVKRENMPNTIFVQTPLTEKEILKKAKEIREERRKVIITKQQVIRERVNSDSIDEIDRTYDLIYIDPPWRYSFSKSPTRDIENHYPTMTQDEMKALKLPSNDNCVMYMWATSPKLIDALDLIKHWGYTYKTHAVWDKEKIGMGYWFRGQHELLLVATKGTFSPPEPNTRKSSVIKGTRGKHSKKPDIVYDLINEWFPSFSKVEIFARNKREGWSSWGNQL